MGNPYSYLFCDTIIIKERVKTMIQIIAIILIVVAVILMIANGGPP